MKNLFKSLAKFYSIVTPVKKDTVNPFFKSDYASLENIQEHIKPFLIESGLVVIQRNIFDGQLFVETKVVDIESGESETSVFPVISSKNDAQSYGSAVSYAKRYSLSGLLNITIVDSDDDGNKAKEPEKKEIPKDKTAEISALLEGSKTLEELQVNYKSLTDAEQKKFASLTTAIKQKLSKPN